MAEPEILGEDHHLQTRMEEPEIRGEDHHLQTIRQAYAETAKGNSVLGGGGGCCGPERDVDLASKLLGYDSAELALGKEGDGSNLGLGCGNPIKLAALQPGERVLDLGAGAGFDALLAARIVGPSGLVIGVDMTPDMLSRARESAAKLGLSEQVSFRLGEIEHVPVADASVDVVVSNCVINLSPNKPAVLAEAYRCLRPGGRIAVSDVVRRAGSGALPEALQTAQVRHAAARDPPARARARGQRSRGRESQAP
jgi:SAM-dependent methyltransferase